RLEGGFGEGGGGAGWVVLKRTLGRCGHVPAELEHALAHHIPVEGIVKAENKGGFDIQIGNLRAFCPASQIDRRRGDTRPPASQYIGQRLRFLVTQIEGAGRNIAASPPPLRE